MDYVIRLTSGAPSYPLPTHGELTWRAGANGGWLADLTLPPLPTGHIVVPSFSDPGRGARHRFELVTANTAFALQTVPVRDRQTDRARTANGAAPISCHIDCWHTHQAVEGATVTLFVDTARPPATALAAVSVRPLDATVAVPEGLDAFAAEPAAISQMQASASVRQRICSPTALAMALSVASPRPSWPEAIAACFDRGTGAYGSWPLAIQLAARYGHVGAVEVLPDWSSVPTILAQGLPMVVSIDYRAGQLTGAAIGHTGGHLVTLYGVSGSDAFVYDPAAPTHSDVPRRYDLGEFTRAWLQRRGAAYIFSR